MARSSGRSQKRSSRTCSRRDGELSDIRQLAYLKYSIEQERQEDAHCIVRELLSKGLDSGVSGHTLAEEEEIVKDVAAVAFEGAARNDILRIAV